jgi:hypothetical protein
MTCACATIPPSGGVTPLEDFLPYVVPYAVGVPDEVAAHAIRLAAIEWAQVTLSQRRVVTIDAQKGLHDYRIEIDDAYEAITVNSVCYRERLLTPLRREQCSPHACGYTYTKPDLLMIYPAADADGASCIKVELTVQMGQDTCFVDRVLYANHAEDLANGALARLLRMKGASWYDLSLAGVHVKAFRQAYSRAKARSARGDISAPLMMTAPRFI